MDNKSRNLFLVKYWSERNKEEIKKYIYSSIKCNLIMFPRKYLQLLKM